MAKIAESSGADKGRHWFNVGQVFSDFLKIAGCDKAGCQNGYAATFKLNR